MTTGSKQSLTVQSPAFAHASSIPREYTSDGANISPPLQWNAPPRGTRSQVVLCEDPDAPSGTFTHWVLYGVPPTVTELDAGLPRGATLPGGLRQGVNDFEQTGYGGPRPPRGELHHYHFRVFALDAEIAPATATRPRVLDAMRGHVLAEGELMGTFRRANA